MFLNTHPRSRLDLSLNHSFEHTSDITCIAFSKDAKYLATGSFGYTQVFDVLTGVKVLALLEEASNPFPTVRTINVVCFNPDGRSLATAGGCGDIRIWDLEQGCILAHLLGEHKGSLMSLDYSPTGHFLVSASNDGTVELWDMTSTAYLFDLPLPQQLCELSWNTVAFSQDGTIIGASAKSGHVFTWKVRMAPGRIQMS